MNHRQIKPFFFLLAMATLATTFEASGAKKSQQTAEGSQDAVIATVNDVPIKENALAHLMGVMAAGGATVPRQAVLNELISAELLRQEAVKIGVDKLKDVSLEIEHQKNAVLARAVLREAFKNTSVTDDDIKKEYQLQIEQMPEKEYHLRNILVESEKDANEIIAQLGDKKSDFSEIAKARSKDGSAKSGGDAGWFGLNSLSPPIKEAVSALKAGGVTPTPVHTETGYHILKLDEIRTVKKPDLDEIRPKLAEIVTQKRVRGYIDELAKKNKIAVIKP